MNLAELVGQKLMLAFVGAEPAPELLDALGRHPIAGVTLFRSHNAPGPRETRALTDALQAAAQAAGRGPLLIGADQEGGQLMAIPGTTPFPGNLALAAAGSDELAHATGRALGLELAAMGVNVNYAPVCDVNINPQNPVIGTPSFGEDPATVSSMAAALIAGMQSAGVAACAKHFPGHGDTASDSHDGLVSVPHSRARLDQVELPPFAAAIAAGAQLVMTAHVALPALTGGQAIPSTLAPQVLRGLLRGEMGFGGVIISDAMDMRAIGAGPALVVDAVAAATAGVDLLLMHADYADQRAVYEGLLQAARRGLLGAADLQASAERVLALKRWLAGQPRPALDVIGSPEHQALAANIAARATTLVRDHTGLLPLRLPPGARVAVVVPQSVDLTPADTSSYIRCELARAVRRYHPGADEINIPADPSESEVAAIRQRLAGYDLAIVGTINATAQPGQTAVVNAALADGIATVVVALRMPYDLAAFPSAPTYLCSYSILPPSVDALADAIWGQAPIAGRLPVSIVGHYPLGHGEAREGQ